jgi:hypothetical protein
MKLRVVSLLFVLLLQAPIRAADTLPVKLTDEAFWGLIQDLSEPSAAFPGENYVSNEPKYVEPLTELLKSSKPGGVYIGVGPEQNFNFIAATKPKMAFILDIRGQNALETPDVSWPFRNVFRSRHIPLEVVLQAAASQLIRHLFCDSANGCLSENRRGPLPL